MHQQQLAGMLPELLMLHDTCVHMQDVKEALRRLPPIEEELRYQRLKRASDCSLKKSYLPKNVQSQQTPFNFYLKVGLARF